MTVDPTKSAPSQIASTSPAELEPVTLRPATLADAPALALVGAATFLEAFTWMIPGVDIIAHCAKHHTIASYEDYLRKPDTRITLATAGIDAPVGFAMLCSPELPSVETFPTDIELKRIYLFSRFRTAPVVSASTIAVTPSLRPAHALLESAVADARALGRKRLLLGTKDDNQRAIAFYRRNHFTEVGTRTFQVGGQLYSDLIFAKEL
jgi:ribosomal protein S18 acetylase RimI-like enzyme